MGLLLYIIAYFNICATVFWVQLGLEIEFLLTFVRWEMSHKSSDFKH